MRGLSVLGPSFPVPDAKKAILVTTKGPAVLTIQTQFFHYFLPKTHQKDPHNT
jgi:hypothetical protein